MPVSGGLSGAVFLDKGPVGGGERLDVVEEGAWFREVAELEPGGEMGEIGSEWNPDGGESFDLGGCRNRVW